MGQRMARTSLECARRVFIAERLRAGVLYDEWPIVHTTTVVYESRTKFLAQANRY
jgi:hypothetical protein